MSKMNDLIDEYKSFGWSVACVVVPPGDEDVEYRLVVEDPEIDMIDDLLSGLDEIVDLLKKRKMELLLENK